ncbi:MAG: NAD(P)-dependent dehydrogenase (short-subunit alcohol dehydrogenase family) [Cellvibrionaceae bacterium]|jgi:NAD(P)-dependent dehydrogenase (short-subunit alcohol dehydrogenase family)
MEVSRLDKNNENVVLITGAASGIGAATVAKYLSNSDFTVLAIDINQTALKRTAENYPTEQQSRIHTIAIDLTDYQEVPTILCKKLEAMGPLHHVVISHAISNDNDITDNNTWDRILDVNLHSSQRLLSLLAKYIHDGGRVVVVSSILGRAGKAANTAYVTSKHALLGLVKALAMDWASRDITVNAVLPSWVDTPMLHRELEPQAAFLGLSMTQMLRRVKKRIPLRKLISSDNVADTIMFLSSPAASMITAQSIVIDGGSGCGI